MMNQQPTAMRARLGLVGWIGVCFAAAYVGSLATMPQIDTWYATLTKPSFNPPDWIFGPVWSVLFLLMAISAWRIWQRNDWSIARRPLLIFAGQLLLNMLWSWLFFHYHAMLAALIEIVLLWLAILAMIVSFYRMDKFAGLLQLPYLAWVSFATVLNASLWWLNQG
jgi:translocator protein